jgi:hypothetical protein
MNVWYFCNYMYVNQVILKVVDLTWSDRTKCKVHLRSNCNQNNSDRFCRLHIYTNCYKTREQIAWTFSKQEASRENIVLILIKQEASWEWYLRNNL